MKNFFPWILIIAGIFLAGTGLYKGFTKNDTTTTDGKVEKVGNLVMMTTGLILVCIAGAIFDLKNKIAE